jgi:HEAT repeats
MTASIQTPEPPRELPPVETPSAAFIVQLFVIPAVVVIVFVVVYLLFGRIAGGERTASEYVQKIKSDNGDWRSAFELASLIQNDSRLAADPKLLGELTELLRSELQRKDANPDLIRYLALTLGVFQTVDATSDAGKAVDPLAALAAALAPGRADTVRQAAAESLARQAARMKGRLEHSGAVEALAIAARDSEQSELRQLATYALGFFGGEAAASALRDRVRTDTDGAVRYNAAAALARRGDLTAYPVLREMLSPKDLAQAVKSTNDQETKHRIETIHLEALRALQVSAQNGDTALLDKLRPDVAALENSDLATVRSEAKALLKTVPKQR